MDEERSRDRPFRFGVVAAAAGSGQEWAEKARRVEALGYATLVVPDGLRHTLAPLPALAAAAAATERLRVGTYVLANDFRNPVLLAKEIATLDRLSDGRFELGLGAGRPGAADDNRMLGLPFDAGAVRVARLAEALAVVRPLLAGQRASASGHYRAIEAEISPLPLQQPGPPILIAGSGRQMLALAGREADIVALGLPPDATVDVAAERIGWLRDAAGQRFGRIELNLSLTAVGDRVPRYLASQLGLSAAGLAERGSIAALTGTIDQMCERLLERRAALGISYLTVSDELMEPLAPVVARLAGR